MTHPIADPTRRPGESDVAYVDRVSAEIEAAVDARLGHLSGEELKLEAARMHDECLAAGPAHRRRSRALARRAYAAPAEIPEMIARLRADPAGALETDEITAGMAAAVLITELEDIARSNDGNG